MYLPESFAETRPEVLQALMRAHPLATLVTAADGALRAEHVPLLWQAAPAPHGALVGHVARGNPLWRALGTGAAALAIFHGPSAYVSPGWYASKRAHGRVVPTWNYAVVHASGTLRAIDDPAWLRALVERLTAVHEAGRTPPWQVSDAPADFAAGMVRGIVGLELAIAGLLGKWKLSQNRDAADVAGVIAGLEAEADAGAHAVAALMRGRGV